MPKLVKVILWKNKAVEVQKVFNFSNGSSISDGPKLVMAKILGPFGVHPSIEDDHPDHFALSHLSTGLMIATTVIESHALGIGELLNDSFAEEFSLETVEEIRAAVPQEIVNWLKRCTKERKWVEL